MIVGIGYRLLPMVLPAEMPRGRGLWVSAIFLQSGITGVFVTLLLRVGLTWIFASLVVAGFGAFFREVNWMVRHRRPKPPAIPVPDPAVLHAAAALAWLAMACILGLWLAAAAPSTWMLRAATAYGVLGLVGFLAQMIVAMERRLLPVLAWYCASAHDGGRRTTVSPHEMPWRVGQEIVFVLWLAGVPALAGGLAFDAVPFVTAGAWSLLAASLLDSVQAVTILRHAYAKPSRTVEPGRINSSSGGRSGLSTSGGEPSGPLLPGSSACRACPTYRRDASAQSTCLRDSPTPDRAARGETPAAP